MEKNGWAGPMIDMSELKEDSVSKYICKTTSNGNSLSYGSSIELGIWHGDVSVVLLGSNLDTETAYQILKSVNPNIN